MFARIARHSRLRPVDFNWCRSCCVATRGSGPAVTGTALVAADNFSARYDLDRSKGVFSRPSHKLAGQSYADRILVLDRAEGGVATAWMPHDMMTHGIVPRALIFNRVNPIPRAGRGIGGRTIAIVPVRETPVI
jgi:uncharacterized protein